MKIRYHKEIVDVEVIMTDETDPDMMYLVWFPDGHELYDLNGVWLEAEHLEVLGD